MRYQSVERWVLDTDILVAALRSSYGASAEIIRAAIMKRVQLIASTALMFEYEAVCTRQEHLAAAGMTHQDMVQLLDSIAALTEPTEMHFLWRPQLRDPNDEMVLETAINGRATAIITFNVRHYRMIPERFGMGILRPAEALGRIQT